MKTLILLRLLIDITYELRWDWACERLMEKHRELTGAHWENWRREVPDYVKRRMKERP